MKKWLFGVVLGIVAASFALDAEAQRRLGGGKTFGRPSPTLQQRQAQPPQQQAPQAQQAAPAQQPAAAGTATPAKPASPLRGALTGLAAGLGLAALASWLGFGETMATVMLVALAGLLLMTAIGYFARRNAAQPAYPGMGSGNGYPPQPPEAMPRPIERNLTEQPGVRAGSAMDEFSRSAPKLDEPWGVPAGFDTEGFLANAKKHFARLQTAWDSGSLDELSEFTTQQMFTALTHELRARAGANKSEVVKLEAKLLGIETDAAAHLASVRFTGTLRIDGEIETFDEVWNLSKPVDGKTGWLLAGIQQLA